ncbi:hypothetical protein [Thermofilum sp.]|nr:hypothetical protein [Thermofilum sp.]
MLDQQDYKWLDFSLKVIVAMSMSTRNMKKLGDPSIVPVSLALKA